MDHQIGNIPQDNSWLVNSMASDIRTKHTDLTADEDGTEADRGRNVFNSHAWTLIEEAHRMESIGDDQAALVPMVCEFLDRLVRTNDCNQVSKP
jgi:hypothetical protein